MFVGSNNKHPITMNKQIVTAISKDGTRMMFNFSTGSWLPFNINKVRKGHLCDGGVMCHTMAQVNAQVNCLQFVATQSVTI